MRSSNCPVGETFGSWTALSRGKDSKHWLCRCECGTVRNVSIQSLREARSISCGCKKGYAISCKNRLEIAGKRYGMLTVIEPVEVDTYGYVRWLCKCDCGNTVIRRASVLADGNIRSCGCMKKQQNASTKRPGAKRKDLTGRTFGALTVLSPASGEYSRSYWHCRCSCGNEKNIRVSSLVAGVTTSCGCGCYKKSLKQRRAVSP